jgi:hypothetical protein
MVDHGEPFPESIMQLGLIIFKLPIDYYIIPLAAKVLIRSTCKARGAENSFKEKLTNLCIYRDAHARSFRLAFVWMGSCMKGAEMAVIRSFWYKGPLSPYENLCLSSFVSHGHQFILYSYEQIEVPAGVQVVDASTLFAETEVYFYTEGASAGSPSAFSNLFRYELLRRYGDWWSDTDVICLRENLPEQDLVFAYEDDVRINGAILKIPAAHPLVSQLVAETRALGTQVRWGQPGPYLITRLVKLNQLEKYLVPTKLLYPIHWSRALDLVDPKKGSQVAAQVHDSVFVHLWNEIFRRAPILKEVAPPEGSFLHHQLCRYDIKVRSGLTYSAYDISRVIENVMERQRALSHLKTVVAERDAASAERDAVVAEKNFLLAETRASHTGASNSPSRWFAHIMRHVSR